MSDYTHTTRKCPVGQLRPDLLEAIRRYFQEHRLGNLEAETLACCETVSTRESASGLFAWLDDNPDSTVYTAMLLTAQRLIWVRSGDRSGLLLNAADLTEIRVRAYSSRLTGATGLHISGHVEGSQGRARGYIGMGPETASQEFCEAAIQAAAALRPSGRRGWWSDLPFV